MPKIALIAATVLQSVGLTEFSLTVGNENDTFVHGDAIVVAEVCNLGDERIWVSVSGDTFVVDAEECAVLSGQTIAARSSGDEGLVRVRILETFSA